MTRQADVPSRPIWSPGRAGVMQQPNRGTQGPAAICAVPDFKPVILAGDAWRFFLTKPRTLARPTTQPWPDCRRPTRPINSDGGIIRLTGGE
jgi:hypothetical protein